MLTRKQKDHFRDSGLRFAALRECQAEQLLYQDRIPLRPAATWLTLDWLNDMPGAATGPTEPHYSYLRILACVRRGIKARLKARFSGKS